MTTQPATYPPAGEPVTLRLEPGVMAAIDSLARAHGKSRDWMANRLLKQQLGQPDDAMLAMGVDAQEGA